MTLKQFNKANIGDKLRMFDGGSLRTKYKMNVVVRLKDTSDNIKRGRRYVVANLIDVNGTLYINSDYAKYCRYENDVNNYFKTLNIHFYGL